MIKICDIIVECHTPFEHLTTNHTTAASDNNMSSTYITPQQIRRRVNDYDSQIREGLEDGSIRQVVKRLGTNLVSKKKTRYRFEHANCFHAGSTFDPSYEGNPRTSRCISAAHVSISIRSGVEQKPDGRQLHRRSNPGAGAVRCSQSCTTSNW